MKYTFDITPIGKPRMTHGDKFLTRKCVRNYYDFKDNLIWQSTEQNYKPTNEIELTFYLPFPKSYSDKKKKDLNLKPHNQKPDLDNMIKAVLDVLFKEDKDIYRINASKFWINSEVGMITLKDL